jgi:hypothetical protein
MGRPKKRAVDLTTDEAIRRVFGKQGASDLKKLARKVNRDKPKKQKNKQ